MEKVYFDGITQFELDEMWDSCGKEYFSTFEEFKDDYIQTRKNQRQVQADNIERHNWLYSITV